MPDLTIKSNGTAIEGFVTNLSFTIQLSEPVLLGTVTYYWSTMDGSALPGSDFTSVTGGSLTFAVGEQTKQISVSVTNDALMEGDEFLFLNVFSDMARTTQVATGVGWISDTWSAGITTNLNDLALRNVESLLLTGTGNINGTGNANQNRITANAGANLLDGAAGDDLLEGMGGADTLLGGLGRDTLDGGTGADSLVGGSGNDLYILDSAADVISGELSGSDLDTVQASFNYTLPGGVYLENLTLVGAATSGAGNEFPNVITGNAAANSLSGNDGSDTLSGLEGIDTLKGGNGDDVLDGGAGANRLEGGLGNDVYRLNNSSETIVELPNEGSDRVEVSLNYSIAARPDLENITLTGDATISARGNASANVLIGNNSDNTLTGGDGNDVLDGKGGRDTLRGGPGDDVYVLADNPWNFIDTLEEAASAGVDTVRVNSDYTLPSNIENLELLGDGDFFGTGNATGNFIRGNGGANFLQGLLGVDTLQGGSGNDTFVLEEAGDVASEETGGNQGTDTVIVGFANTVPFALLDAGATRYIENITLDGPASWAVGNTLNNVLLGNLDGDTLEGGGGSDTLDGGAGPDSLIGGSGTDYYRVNIFDDDTIVESATTDTDTIELLGSDKTAKGYNMATNVEILSYNGIDGLQLRCNDSPNGISMGPGNDSVTGFGGNDTVDGKDGNDTLLGGDGNDTLIGGLGTDSIAGGDENDSLLGGLGTDMIEGNDGDDTLDGGQDADRRDADVMIGGLGDDVYRVSGAYDIVTELLTGGLDTVETPISYRLGPNFENLTLTGSATTTGHGNSLNNLVVGNNSANTLDGLAGDDTLLGNSGNDTLLGQAGNDSLKGDEGNDLLHGHAGDDTLDGGTNDTDTLMGGVGNDFYVTDSLSGVFEKAGEGVDTISSNSNYILPVEVENLILTGTTNISGTGNVLANTITGNGGSNFLDGGTGNDTMMGGLGNDFYFVDSLLDVVMEEATPTSGVDLVFAWVSGYTLPTNLENLSLIGTAVSGTGNSVSNRIVGNATANNLNGGDGNDLIDGQGGNDTMIGGLGNDTFVVDSTAETIVELSGSPAGTADMVVAYVNYALADNVEILSMAGDLPTAGKGNILNNQIYGSEADNVLSGLTGNDILIGNGGNDTLVGGSGNDTLTGGSGADHFDYVSTAIFSASTFGNDVIKDFRRSDGDKINLGKTTFGLSSAVGANPSGTEFASVSTEDKVGASPALIVFSQATGNLYYNPNGSTAGGDVLIATIEPLDPAIANTDFVVS